MCGETLNVHLRQAFDLAGEPVVEKDAAGSNHDCHSHLICCFAGVPCGRLQGYLSKGEVNHKFKKHGVEAAKSVGINKAEIKMAARCGLQAMVWLLNPIVPS